MESTTTPLSDAASNFSFGTAGPWTGFDVQTMRIHSRARVIQSQHRAKRFGRDTALELLIESGYAQRIVEDQESREVVVDLREQEARDQNALRDLAAQGERQIAATRETKAAPRASLRHLQALVQMDAPEDLEPAKQTASSSSASDRDALIDLRREHHMANREPVIILRDTQPRSAAAGRRWG